MPPEFSVTPLAPVSVTFPARVMPLPTVVVSVTPLPDTGPVTFKLPVLLRVNAPLLVKAPRLAIALAWSRVTLPPALPLRVPADAVIVPAKLWLMLLSACKLKMLVLVQVIGALTVMLPDSPPTALAVVMVALLLINALLRSPLLTLEPLAVGVQVSVPALMGLLPLPVASVLIVTS